MDVTALLIVVVAWIAVGVATAIVLWRHGHDPRSWLPLGVVFGPLTIALARNQRWRSPPGPLHRLAGGTTGGGTVDVLVGVDDVAAGIAAVGEVVDLLGPSLGRLVLAHVIDRDEAAGWSDPVDPATSTYLHAHEAAACRLLDAVVAGVGEVDPEVVVLGGDPGAALAAHAEEEHLALVVVAARGPSVHRLLRGAVLSRLVGRGGVPVLVVTPDAVDRATPAGATAVPTRPAAPRRWSPS